MEKKKNKLIPVVIVLIILVLGLGGFIVYDKVLKTDNENNVVDNNENKNNDSKKEFNETNLKKWLSNADTLGLISLTNDYKLEIADDEFYSRFLGLYIMFHGRGAEPEIVDGKYQYCLNKNVGMEVIKKYFKVSKVNLRFNDIKNDNNSILTYYEDNNKFCVLVTPTGYDTYNHDLINIVLNSQNQIEVFYGLLGSYMNDENMLSYYGYKRIVLEEVNDEYKILEIETSLKDY